MIIRKGKWHASHADIIVPDTHDSYLTYDNLTGIPIPENQRIYLKEKRGNNFGFNGWVGPEPHGTNPHDSGASAAIGLSGRDQIYASEVIKLLNELQHKVVKDQHEQKPWAIAAPWLILMISPYLANLPGYYLCLISKLIVRCHLFHRHLLQAKIWIPSQ